MKIVIYGANEIACLIATRLFEDHDIVIIDNETGNSEIFEKLDLEYIQGSASNISVLEAIGIKDADIFIACTENDEANIVACLTVTNMTKLKTVCFVSKKDNVDSLSLVRGSKYQKEVQSELATLERKHMTEVGLKKILNSPNSSEAQIEAAMTMLDKLGKL